MFGTEGVDVHFVVDGFVHIKSFWLPIVKKKKKNPITDFEIYF